jgi:UDP-hydrolysing UDP-N-acetyl-D-glucosamine 2-epimerase
VSRTVAVVTSSRADYSHLYWPLRALAEHPDIDLKVIVFGAHLSPEFGLTIEEIEKDGFAIDGRIECLLSSDTDVGMAKTIGVATLSLADLLGTMRPDILLLIADRYEMLAPASVALALRIPVAHIEGGEISEGAGAGDCVGRRGVAGASGGCSVAGSPGEGKLIQPRGLARAVGHRH